MALVRRRDPSPLRSWDLGNRGNFLNDFERLFNWAATPAFARLAQALYPLDLYETDQELVLEMAVPGVKVEDLDISIEGRQLTITGTLPEIGEDEGRRYWLQNIPHGQFSQTVTLPAAVEVADVRAEVHEGLLTLTMPKLAEARARKITINR